QLCPALLLRLEVRSDAERTIRVDAPGELDPELVLLPDLARIDLPAVLDRLSKATSSRSQDRLTKPEPLRVMRLVRVEIVPLGAHAHGQHVVGEECRLAPGRRQSDVKADLGPVHEHLDPAEAVGIGPDGVVDTGEIDLKPPSAFIDEMRQ